MKRKTGGTQRKGNYCHHQLTQLSDEKQVGASILFEEASRFRGTSCPPSFTLRKRDRLHETSMNEN
jgi:hypothetical protein